MIDKPYIIPPLNTLLSKKYCNRSEKLVRREIRGVYKHINLIKLEGKSAIKQS